MTADEMETQIQSLRESVDRLQRDADWRRKNSRSVQIGCTILALLMIAAAVGSYAYSFFAQREHMLFTVAGGVLIIVGGAYSMLSAAIANPPTDEALARLRSFGRKA